MENIILQKGQRVWDAFAKGWATGSWEEYTGLLSHQLEFSFPVGPFRGKYVGREGYEKMLQKIQADEKTGYRLIFSITHIEVDNESVMFEYDAVGFFDGYHYNSRNAIAFGITEDKITAYREYFGDIDIDMFEHFKRINSP